MKKFTFLLTLITSVIFAQAQTTHLASYICSSADCGTAGSDVISAAPTDGTTFYVVWYVSSSSAITSASQTPQPSATSGTANMGSTTITNYSGSNYRISTSATINVNQAKPTVSNIDMSLSCATAASFPSAALTGSFSFNTTTPLPVDFLDIRAESLTGFNLIKWSTGSETNNDYFAIERSYDGIKWEVVGEMDGAGNSAEILDYSFSDESSLPSTKTFYQIAQYDFDGRVTRSDVVMLQKASSDVTIYPNPATSDVITINSELDVMDLKVRNIAGQEMDVEFNFDSHTLDIASLEAGIYFISVNDTVVKLIK